MTLAGQALCHQLFRIMTSVSRGIMSRFVSHNELTLSLRAAVAAPPRPSLLFEHTVGDSAIGAHRGGGRLLPALPVGTTAPRPVRPLPPRRAPPACLRVSLATRPAVPAAAAAVDCPRCPWRDWDQKKLYFGSKKTFRGSTKNFILDQKKTFQVGTPGPCRMAM